MDLEDSLCQVDPNDRNLLHGCLLRCGWSCNITSLAHFDAVGRGHPPHQNSIRLSAAADSGHARDDEGSGNPSDIGGDGAIAKGAELREPAMSLSAAANPPRDADDVRPREHHTLHNLKELRRAMLSRRSFLRSSAASAAYLGSPSLATWAANAPGVTDTEIKVGQTMPYSGPASSVMGMIGRADT